MDTRKRIAIGGTTALAVCAAVVATVGVTNAAVLAESPGSPVQAATVEIQPVPDVTLSPAPVSGPADVSPVTTPVTDPPPVAETVPAPAPVIVVPGPELEVPADPAPIVKDEEAAIDDARSSGRWDRLYAWAAENGWTRADVDRWIAAARDAHGGAKSDTTSGWKSDSTSGWQSETKSGTQSGSKAGLQPDTGSSYSDGGTVPAPAKTSASAEKTSVSDTPQRRDGSKRDRSHGSSGPRD